ncbi:MAG: TonB-dependent receptor [Candidatus Acidiferrales bacterium]
MNWKRFSVYVALLFALAVSCRPAWSQATISTGSIQGTVTDPEGAVVSGAKVTITSQATGRTIQTSTDGSGLYNSGSLAPGRYMVHVEDSGFKTVNLTVTVQVGSISTGNIKLTLGTQGAVVEVTGNAVTVNTEQAQIQEVVTQQQIENLPSNGRNFLDLAQLAPGVQIQDGSNFDPTKTGFSSISFGGRYGRTARIEVDGVDVSDETVGTTTTDIPESAIAEFQLAQSSLDMSNELTSSGAVNVVTRSGTNTLHGGAYGSFRDSSQDATFPGNGTFQRNQEGGNVGGPILKDKLFFFAAAERTLQHAGAGVPISAPFADLTGNFPSPFKEDMVLGRLDFQATRSLHLFYRYNYFTNYLIPSFGGAATYSFFANKNISREHVLGADWSSGEWTHSIRFQYLKFENQITDAVRGSGEPFADLPVATDFFVSGLATGPSDNAPQVTPQSDHQFKYDGSRVWGSHIFRFGMAYNHIQGGGFASFFANAPLALNFQDAGAYDATAGLTCPNGDTGMSCPLNYVAEELLIGNGQGYSTEKPAFGRPFGGLGPDNRLAFYVGDSWKIYPNFTLTYGVRWDRDTGRTDSDLPPIPALNLVLPGLGDRVNQPNSNFGPQLGLAWDPWNNGKTAIRAGVGLYYENSIFNNVEFDRPARLQTGTFFFSDATPCLFGSAGPVAFGDGSVQFIPGGNTTCSTGIGAPIPASAVGATCPAGITVAQCMANFQSAYVASYAAHPLNPNPNYLGNLIAQGLPLSGAALYAPNFKSPRSVQMNIGVQRQLSPGTVLSVDYLRNIGEDFLLGIDANHTGDAAYLNQTAAANAINTTNASFGCGTGVAGVNCAIAGGATITDYANNGLDSPGDLNIGECSNATNGIGVPCAFGGINPNIGPTDTLYPDGRSTYNALEVELKKNARSPIRGIRYLNGVVSYTLSRFEYSGSSNGLSNPGTPGNQDQDFIDNSMDHRNPNRFMGPTLLDRTNQFSFGGYADLPGGFELGTTAHFFSPLAVTPLLDVPAGAGSIFQTDFTGDGTVNDPLPIAQTSASCGSVGGSCDYTTYKTGAYGRTLGPRGLANAITNYDNAIAGKTITPAGQALVNAGLITQAQLIALGATPQTIAPADPAAVGLSWLKTMDVQLSWKGHIGERYTIQPGISFYNVFNFANFDSAGDTLSGALSGSAGSIGYTTATGPNARTNRVGAGTGVFALGSPRVIEWNLKFSF